MIGAPPEFGIYVSIATKSHPEAVMLVSLVDYKLADTKKWTLDKTGYAVARVDSSKDSFHRVVMGVPTGHLVDHINRDKLDNRRSNLRPADGALNGHNRNKRAAASSQFCGVSWNQSKAKWIAQIRRGQIQQHLGHFDSEIRAAVAYDKAATQLYGQDARLNFPCVALACTR